jgi:hypothetical protein
VRQEGWNVSFSGGFTVSGLTSRVFSVKTDNGVKKVFEEPDKQDHQKLGAASFVHLFHDGVAWKQLQPALAFGIGINSDNHAEYLLGAGLRFGDRATFNVGRVWGSVSRLPNGVTTDAPVTDDNVLNNLGTQVVSRWFVALTYSFIDTKDRLLKPFAQEAAATPTNKPSVDAKQPAVDLTPEVLADIKTSAKQNETYQSITPVWSLLNPNGAAKLQICDVEAQKGPDNKAQVTVHVKSADPNQLQILNAAGKSGDASDAISKAVLDGKKETVAVGQVTFDTGKCPQ